MPLLLFWLLTLLGRPSGPPEPKATVYIFLADTCPISQGVTPELRELYFRYARQGVGFGGVFPDPATSAATAAFELPRAAAATLTLLDETGRTVRTLALARPAPAGPHRWPVPLDKLPAGLYFLRLEADGASQTEKLVVQ